MELYVKQETIKLLPQVDALLLDVDGVILDVAETFRVVAGEVAQLFATKWLDLPDTGPLFLAEECELFKMAGGFNNDWDLTNAAVALIIAKQAQHSDVTGTAELRALAPDWGTFTSEIKRAGGGLVAAESYILNMLSSQERHRFARTWSPKLITQLFQEMYAGDTECHALYGFVPEHVHGPGYLDKETVLIDGALLPRKTNCGVLTGRTHAETHIALQRAALLERIPDSAWVTETDGIRKPDGETLALLQSRLGFKLGIYIGDTLDDLRVVQNFRETNASGRARVLSCIVLSGPAGENNRRLFLEAGAEIVAPDINSVLTYLGGILK